MPLSVRIDDDTRAVLEKTARVLRASKSQVIKMSIREFCTKALHDTTRSPFELIKDLVGEEKSKRGDLSIRGEEILRERFKAKR